VLRDYEVVHVDDDESGDAALVVLRRRG
jgi:hypothetical protein